MMLMTRMVTHCNCFYFKHINMITSCVCYVCPECKKCHELPFLSWNTSNNKQIKVLNRKKIAAKNPHTSSMNLCVYNNDVLVSSPMKLQRRIILCSHDVLDGIKKSSL